VPDPFGVIRLSECGISHLSDNMMLQLLRGESELKHAITVLKSCGSADEQHIRQCNITSEGLSLGERFEADKNLL
jgi:circadian clock protein KaiC